MDLSGFLKTLKRDMRDLMYPQSAAGEMAVPFEEAAFTGVVAGYMAAAGMTFSPQLCQFMATVGGSRVRLNGYALSDSADRLDLFVSVYRGAEMPVALEDDELAGAAAQCAGFLMHCLDGSLGAIVDESHDAFGLIGTIGMAYDSIGQVSIYVLTDALSGDAELSPVLVAGKTVAVSVMDSDRLAQIVLPESADDMVRTTAEFRSDLIASVLSDVQRTQDTAEACFADEAGVRLSDAEQFSDFQRCQYRRRAADGEMRVDGFASDDADGSFALLVTDFSSAAGLPIISPEEVQAAFETLRRFAEAALAGELAANGSTSMEPGVGLAADMLRMAASITRLRMYLVTDRFSAVPVETEEHCPVAGIPVEAHFWDIGRLHRAFISDSGRDDIEVSFLSAAGAPLPALNAGASGGGYEGYLCTISGEVLADIYERHGSRLLEGNVRSFLSTKGKINAGIQSTLRERPEMFFAYNNGIAATAEAVVLVPGDGLRIATARNFQIVNGGQTTASLATAARLGVDLSQVRVQMKLSVLPSQKAGDLIPLIARFANSQNRVNESDFFANHPYHLRLEQISRRLSTPVRAGGGVACHWYYERSRGQYLNDQKNLQGDDRSRFLSLNPKSQLLTKLDIAKLENTWKGLPHKVSLGAQKNFLVFAGWLAKRWADDDTRFDDSYYRDLVSMAILFRHTEQLVREQDWYQGGYRPNIVTYCLALLQYVVLKHGKGLQLDLAGIWDGQAVPDALTAQLAVLARIAFNVLTDPKRPKANITEWAKTEACWEGARASAGSLLPQLAGQLIDPLAERYRGMEKGGAHQVGYGVFARTAVLGVEAGQWADIMNWGVSQNLLDARELALLRTACRLPKFLPSVKECERIWDIRTRMIRNGFRVETTDTAGRISLPG